tara:strand:- start:163 stop:711 length:549 start_codon:yes stop_codon:yes gene_type:complete
MDYKIKKILMICLIPLLGKAQNDKLQTIGSATNYLIECPCKLFKYYEDGNMFYLCKDKKTNLEYRIIEYKHKDRIDVILNTIKKNINKKDESILTNSNKTDQHDILHNYLKKNSTGVITSIMKRQAILVENKLEHKLFFLDSDFISSHELIVSGTDSTIVKYYFTKVVESLMLKKENINKVF